MFFFYLRAISRPIFKFGLDSLDCRSDKETDFSFFFLLLELVQCLDNTFYTLPSAQLSKFSRPSVILKHREKNFEMMTSIVRLSSTRFQYYKSIYRSLLRIREFDCLYYRFLSADENSRTRN